MCCAHLITALSGDRDPLFRNMFWIILSLLCLVHFSTVDNGGNKLASMLRNNEVSMLVFDIAINLLAFLTILNRRDANAIDLNLFF